MLARRPAIAKLVCHVPKASGSEAAYSSMFEDAGRDIGSVHGYMNFKPAIQGL